MAIMRFSGVGTVLFAPQADGTFVSGPYDKSSGVGKIGSFDTGDDAAKQLDIHVGATLDRVAGRLDGPVTVMANGFLFDPRASAGVDPMHSDNPHAIIFHFRRGDETQEAYAHATGWPAWLGFQEADDGADGLAVAFGWYSSPDFVKSLLEAQKNFYIAACDLAVSTAGLFAAVIRSLSRQIPDRPIDIVCHSLGSRLAIKGLQAALMRDPGLSARLGRIIILGGAEYSAAARKLVAMLDTSVKHPEIYNFMGTSDAVLKRLGQNFGPGEDGDHKVIGNSGLMIGGPATSWIDLVTGSKVLNAWFEKRNDGVYLVSDLPNQAADHWGYYSVRGNMKFFARLLRERSNWRIADLRAAGIPEGR